MRIKIPRFAIVGVMASLAGCAGEVAKEADKAERDGRIINNEMMVAWYPSSFSPGSPPYLERDFEAGADFICDEIKRKRGQDICADADIKWR
jgi:hypothetical protein